MVRAHIDLSALRHNFQVVRNLVGPRSIMAMIKADAYGHGLLRVAEALPEADAFGVASIPEAIHLREIGITQPIVIMSRFDRVEQISLCLHYQLAIVIHQLYQVEILEQNPPEKPLSVWLKLETGMHRLGLPPEEFTEAWRRLQCLSGIQKPLTLMTHLACADDPDNSFNHKQIKVFHQVTDYFPGPKSIANSGAILSNPESLTDWVRPGIMLYGASPFAGKTGKDLGLRPVMNLISELIAVRQLRQGDYIGYGADYRCPKDMRVGIVAIGYGDGYPRHISGASVLVNNILCPLVGRVSMDMIAVDLTLALNSQVGDAVILWGKGLPVEHIAKCANTISYELLCQVTRRVEFMSTL